MSTEEIPTRELLLAELAEFVEPMEMLSSPEAVSGIVRLLGWDVPEETPFPVDFGLLVTGAGDVETALDQFEAATTDEARNAALGALLTAATEVLGGIVKLGDDLSQGLTTLTELVDESDIVTELPRRLLDLFVMRYLVEKRRGLVQILTLLGLVEFVAEDADPARHRVDALVPRVYWERLPLLFSDPRQLLDKAYGWSTNFRGDRLLTRVANVGGALGWPLGEMPQDTALADALHRPPDPRTEYRLAFLQEGDIWSGTAAELGIRLCEVPAETSLPHGIAALPYATGAVSISGEIAQGWRLELKTALDLTGGIGLVLRPPDHVAFEPDLLGGPVLATGKLGLTLRRVAAADQEIILIGAPGKTRLALHEFATGVLGSLGPPPDITFSVDLTGLVIAVVPGDGDGFLQKILPAGGVKATGDLGLDASPRTGLTFRGSGGFEVELPLALSLAGVIELKMLWIRLAAAADGLHLKLGATIVVRIGPVSGSVERIGLRADLRPLPAGQSGNLGALDVGFAFQPPAGAGLSIKAGPVTGGGYLFFDPDAEQYAGVLELSFNAISITVIGLLTTRLPDPSGTPGATKKGFSLLLIVAVELPPIQLGYGFTLNGIGGLLGINRTMMVEPLRNGVRDGTVNSILFPKDVVARAPQIISQLKSIFPPAEGRYVFGPMVKIGWGPNAIIEVSVALVLELTSPIRLVILGRFQVALPDKKDPVLNLRLDVVGVIDFDKGEISVDASLVDSRLVVFSLTGDMAVRIGWGATKMFALAAGGFHPAFQPPPGFPSLRRLAIALANSDNPRLRLEAYMALTANTIQFGAALDAYVKLDTFAGTFSVSANLTFDALIQFSPFELKADLGAQVDIQRNGVAFLHAALHASLTGPTPWHALGYAEFDFLGKRRIDFEAIAGSPAGPPVLRINGRDVLGELVKAFAAADAWVALPPGEADRIVSITGADAAGHVVVHPLGALSARQRVLPLGTSVDRFGAAVMDPTTFRLDGFAVGSGATQAPAQVLYDDFSPGQFKALTDDEQVARPAFETLRSGGHVAVASFRLPATRASGVSASSDYVEAIVDVEPGTLFRSHRPPDVATAAVPAATLAALAGAGAAAHAATRAAGAAEFRGPTLGVTVEPERWKLADPDTLQPAAGAPAESCAEAHDRLAAAGAGATPCRVGELV
jgi:hypothetical protein